MSDHLDIKSRGIRDIEDPLIGSFTASPYHKKNEMALDVSGIMKLEDTHTDIAIGRNSFPKKRIPTDNIIDDHSIDHREKGNSNMSENDDPFAFTKSNVAPFKLDRNASNEEDTLPAKQSKNLPPDNIVSLNTKDRVAQEEKIVTQNKSQEGRGNSVRKTNGVLDADSFKGPDNDV